MPGYEVGFGLGGSEQIGQLGFLHGGREISWQACVRFALLCWETEMLEGRRRRKRRAAGAEEESWATSWCCCSASRGLQGVLP